MYEHTCIGTEECYYKQQGQHSAGMDFNIHTYSLYTLHYNIHTYIRICSTLTYIRTYVHVLYMYTCICEYSISLHYNIHTYVFTCSTHIYVHVHVHVHTYVSTDYHCYRKLENSCGSGYHVVTTGGSECCHTTSSVVRNSKKEEKTQEREFAGRYVIL